MWESREIGLRELRLRSTCDEADVEAGRQIG